MQKWEYMVITEQEDEVLTINGELQRKTHMTTLVIKGPNLKDFLRDSGEKGWEAVSMCVVVSPGGSKSREFLFKRYKE